MPPFNGGGEMIREVFEDRVIYGEPPYKFEAGTPSIVQAIGLGAAIDYVSSVGKARIRSHEHGLMRYAHDRLREINSLRIFGTAKDKGPIVSFEMKGAHPHDVATIIDRSGVAVRAGTHCVMPLLGALRRDRDLPRVVRHVQYARGGRCASRRRWSKRRSSSHDRRTEDAMTAKPRRAEPPASRADGAERPSAIPPDEMARLTDEIVAALKTVYDPEIPADIYELGLIYKVDIDDDRIVTIDMTLTTPNCPSAAELPAQVENAVAGVPGVREAKVNIVWDPPWDPSRMSDEARTVLDMW